MKQISYDISTLSDWISKEEIEVYAPAVLSAQEMLEKGSGPGSDYLGWLNLPQTIDSSEVKRVGEAAEKIRDDSDILICIGIGGSYLGARAAIDFLSPTFQETEKTRVLFAGHQVNSDYLSDLLNLIQDKDVSLNVISKSGTTTEPGITFRVLRQWMEKKYGSRAGQRIYATTDPAEGALRKLATDENYTTFCIPPNVGGRFSVLTAVGLLPIAAAGIDISGILSGASEAHSFCSGPLAENDAACYAAVRNILFRRGKCIEMLAGFQPQLHFISEWWKQLFGESEGKSLTGIFPAAVDYTTDLHSMGQWMQEGVRNIFETFMILKNTRTTVAIPSFEDNLDGLNYLAGRSFEAVNESAFKGTLLAHIDGGVPCATLTLEKRDTETLGQLFYFFEKATAISGYLLRVNPFNQPGVEAYKKNMFALLHKPGHDEAGKKLDERLARIGL